MRTFLLEEEFQKGTCTVLVIGVIIMFLLDIFRDSGEAVEVTEPAVVLFQEEQTTPSLVGQLIDTIEGERSIILIHSDDPSEWGKVLEDDGLGNIAVGFNRSESVAVETEVLP